ncbi:STAS domain-containing protein [Maridesulfovibrio hydrothermalis]|uniref:Anti-sigma factor antagonist n=1 Tax=Maridesulfovibrio hydrothermalis AM13 = DSM 14728 TaxID=1121451 RepID=L0RC52_9BACT|nr:STAS domain-containing protein [Maridesulfovibrio hydrothermalis]CCO24329.1 Stage II sporulation protein [Maridesulfovibrio hydrothermalis AM13 = DSM 14728]
MEISFNQIDEVTVVKINSQELNHVVSHDFQRQIAPLFDEKKFNIALDMSSVDFMDSMGIGTLITLRNKLMKEKGCIAMFNITDRVKKIIDIAALHKIFELYGTEEDAVEGLKQQMLA